MKSLFKGEYRMKLIEELIDNSGFCTTIGITEQKYNELHKKAVELDFTKAKDRAFIIECFVHEVEHFYLLKWNDFIKTDNVSEELYKRVENIIHSVEIVYSSDINNFYFYFDEDFFGQNHPYDCELFDEEDVLEIISSSWELSSMFMTEEQKRTAAEKVVVNKVKEITEKTAFLQELYNKLPELLSKTQ